MKDELRSRLTEAAKSYLEQRPWDKLANDDYLGIHDTATGDRGWATVLGDAGEEFGVALYLGDDSRSVLERMLQGDLTEEQQSQLVDALVLTVVDPAEAPRLKESMLLDARVELKGKSMIPMAFRVERGKGTRPLRDREATLLTRTVEGLSSAYEHGLTKEDVRDETGARLLLTLDGALKVEVHSRREARGLALAVDLEHDLHVRPRTKRLVAVHSGGRLVIGEPKEGLVLDDLVGAEVEAGARRLVEVLAGRFPALREACVPRDLWVEPDELAVFLAEPLRKFGVKVQARDVSAEIAKLRKGK